MFLFICLIYMTLFLKRISVSKQFKLEVKISKSRKYISQTIGTQKFKIKDRPRPVIGST